MYKIKQPNEILTENTKYRRGNRQLKRCLLQIGREWNCEKCGLSEWLGEILTLEIHHINGNPYDNNQENLEILCPNCHSLTPNFYNTKKQTFCECGKPKIKISKTCVSCFSKKPRPHSRKVERPTKEELEKLALDKPITSIAKEFGVTDKAVHKWCKTYGIKSFGRGSWTGKKKL